jgi:hypothetical protein
MSQKVEVVLPTAVRIAISTILLLSHAGPYHSAEELCALNYISLEAYKKFVRIHFLRKIVLLTNGVIR